MRKNLLTDIVEHIAVMKSPKNTTTPAVIANSSHVSTSIMPGLHIQSIYSSAQGTTCNECRKQTKSHISAHKRTSDESP